MNILDTPPTETDNKIAEKERINKQPENKVKETKTKLLTGYTNNDGEPKEYSNLATLANNPLAKKKLTMDLESAYHLAYNTDSNKAYLFDYTIQSYIELDKRILQEFLGRNEGIRLETNETDRLINSTIKRINNNYNYIEFNNKLFNLKTYDYEDKTEKIVINGKEYGTQKPKPFITPKRINHDILTAPKHEFNRDNNILFKSLRQILGTEENFKDFKQRIGSIIFNKGKEITIYYNPAGNNGKTILIMVIKLLLGVLVRITDSKQLNDKFNQELFNHVHGILFDETKEGTFKDTEDQIKKLTGGGVEEETRKIQANEIIKTYINSHVIIGTNELPEFNLNDTALFNRITIIKLPNQFSYHDHEIDNKTVFLINENLLKEIKEDNEGIEHLLYDCIKEYILMKDNKEVFINKKGLEYARGLYYGNDPLMNFLKVHTKRTETQIETTTADEILNNYKQYIKDKNMNLIINDKETKKEIGIKLNNLYKKENIIRDMKPRPIEYKNIKCTYYTGVETKYFVDPNLEDYNIMNEDYNRIFNLIKKDYNSFELLKQQVNEHDKILEAIEWLKENLYILEDTILQNN